MPGGTAAGRADGAWRIRGLASTTAADVARTVADAATHSAGAQLVAAHMIEEPRRQARRPRVSRCRRRCRAEDDAATPQPRETPSDERLRQPSEQGMAQAAVPRSLRGGRFGSVETMATPSGGQR